MPASAGRVRMPHNNRMSTSATLKTHAIWQTAIGHDPYANETEKNDAAMSEADKEKAKNVMQMANNQNLTDGAKRGNYTEQMYRGLKQRKQRRAEIMQAAETVDPKLQQLLEDPSSSSEDEFIKADVKVAAKKGSSSGNRRKKNRKRDRIYSSDSSGSASDDSSKEQKRKRRREKRKKKHSKRARESSSGDDSIDSETEGRKRKRKDKRKRKEGKKSSRKEER